VCTSVAVCVAVYVRACVAVYVAVCAAVSVAVCVAVSVALCVAGSHVNETSPCCDSFLCNFVAICCIVFKCVLQCLT